MLYLIVSVSLVGGCGSSDDEGQVGSSELASCANATIASQEEIDAFAKQSGVQGLAEKGGMSFDLPDKEKEGALFVFASSDAARRGFATLVQKPADYSAPLIFNRANVVATTPLLLDGERSRSEALARGRTYIDRAVFEPCAGGRSKLASFVGGPGDQGVSGDSTSTIPEPEVYTDSFGSTVPTAP